MSRPIKIGEQIVLYGKIKKFNELTGLHEYLTDITDWEISSSVRDEDVNGAIVGNFVKKTSPDDTYFYTLDTTAILTSQKIAIDIRFSPPGGLPGFSKTYTYFLEKSVTPP